MITKEQIMPFCGDDETRPMLMQPFTRNGFTYATSGRIIVQVDALPGCEGSEFAPKNLASVMSQFPSETKEEWTAPPPKVERPKCNSCDGLGQCECACCDNIHVCGYCDGTGEGTAKIKIAHRVFNDDLIEKIRGLPNPLILQRHGECYDPMPFKFDGGIGLVMPMKE